jgi:hypothetical protein
VLARNRRGIATTQLKFQDPTVSHPASQVTAGTFDSGNFSFPDSLFVTDRVGVGTTSPSSKLHVYGDSQTDFGVYDTPLIVKGDSYSYVYINGTANQAGILLARNTTQGFFTGLNNDGKYRIADLESIDQNGVTNAKDGSEGITIQTDGNVGIGTTSPDEKLRVSGTVKADKIRVAESGDPNNDDRYWNISGSSNLISIQRTDFTGATGLHIDTNGNVGIGTTSPGGTLDVYGGNVSIVMNGGVFGADVHKICTRPNGAHGACWETYAGISARFTSFNQVDDWKFTRWNGSTLTDLVTIVADNGNVGIGTTGPESRLQVTGGGLCVGSDANCNTDNNAEGVVYSSSTSMTVYDVAENFPTKENLSELDEGTVLVLDSSRGVFVKRSSKPYDSLVVGVVSLKPAVLLGGFNGKQFENETQIAVALAGRVPVKVTTKNGNIRIGDLLTTSDIPGTAMKCDENCKLGNVVGKALENFNGKEGKILVLVSLQ